MCVCAQLCLTLFDPVDYSPPGSPVHGILQARILEWVAISFSRGSFWPRDQTSIFCVSCIASGFFTTWAMGKPLGIIYASRLLSFYFIPYQEDQRLDFFSIIHTTNLFTEFISTDNSADTIWSEISFSYNWNYLVTEQWENFSILV